MFGGWGLGIGLVHTIQKYFSRILAVGRPKHSTDMPVRYLDKLGIQFNHHFPVRFSAPGKWVSLNFIIFTA